MLISIKNKFIFIHNYKVAGTSIVKALERVALLDPKKNICFMKISEDIPPLLYNRLTEILYKINIKFKKRILPGFNSHITSKELKKQLPISVWNNYFKFGFVRNPWDWQVSMYHFMLQNKKHFQHDFMKNMKDFEKDIIWRVNKDKHLQKEFFYDDKGNCLVDFIGKFEDLEKDFNKICKKIGVKVELPFLNKSKRKKDYRKYYNEYTKKLIAEHFKEDIKIFKYKF